MKDHIHSHCLRARFHDHRPDPRPTNPSHTALLEAQETRGLKLHELTELIDLRIQLGLTQRPVNAYGEAL